ncbi:[trimethylamine--corrinoid protein] Co-methyltransferase [Desulfobacula sp.]
MEAIKSGHKAIPGFSLPIFTDDEIHTLHQATLDLLEKTGVKVESEQALEIFDGSGAKVNKKGNTGIVKIPGHIIEECIQSTPGNITYHGRKQEHGYRIKPGHVGFSTFGECIKVIDPETRLIEPASKKALGKASLLVDYLDQIVLLERPMGSLDKPAMTQSLHNFEAMVSNSSKHIFMGCNSGQNARKIFELAAVCMEGTDKFRDNPIITSFVTPTSPLELVHSCCDVIIESARAGVGVAPISMVLSGATAPVTLAGAIVQHNAEVLSAITLAQLTKKGTHCTYASCSTIMDLRFSTPAVGAPEFGIISAGLAKLARFYDLPSWVGGGHSNSKIPDAQAAYEAALTATVSALSGANIIYGAGCLDSGLTFDFSKLVMDSELIDNIFQVLKGIEVNEKTIALNIIHEAGPGGEFLTRQHTFDHMRQMSRSSLFDRRNRDKWMELTNGKDLTSRAYEKASHILETHKPMALPSGAAQTMKEIIKDYEKSLGII